MLHQGGNSIDQEVRAVFFLKAKTADTHCWVNEPLFGLDPGVDAWQVLKLHPSPPWSAESP